MCAACMLYHACLSMGFRDLSCDLAGGLSYTKWPFDVRSLGHHDAIARDSVTWHTLLYDRARPRPRLSDRAGVVYVRIMIQLITWFRRLVYEYGISPPIII